MLSEFLKMTPMSEKLTYNYLKWFKCNTFVVLSRYHSLTANANSSVTCTVANKLG